MKKKERKTDGGPKLSFLLRSRMFVAAIILLSIAAATVSIISARTIRRQWYNSEEHLRSVAEDRSQAFDNLERVFSAMMRQRAGHDYPLSPEMLVVLAELTTSYNQFVLRHANDASLRVDRMRACRLLGQVYSLHSLVHRAESEYREERRILVELLDEELRPDYRYLLAENGLLLSHLLAGFERTQEARESSLGAMHELVDLANDFPNAPQYVSELAIAYNNIGLLSLSLGSDEEAEQHLRQSLSTMESLVDGFPDDFTYLERLIDSQQILVGVLWSTGRVEDARELNAQSLSAIRQYRESSRGSSLDLEIAQEMALKNETAIEKRIAAGQNGTQRDSIQVEASCSDRLLFSEWSWRSVSLRDGKSIQPDVLVKGVLPADFEQHDALLLGFDWGLGKVWEKVCLQIVAATWQRVQIIILVPDAPARELLAERLRQMNIPVGRIHLYQIPPDTVWVRDYGPLVVRTGQCGYRLVDPQYGAMMRTRDDRVPSALGDLMRIPTVPARIAVEGGNLLTNGRGLCIATTQLLEMNQNLGCDEDHVANTIKRLFGAEQIVYLERLNDEETGHVDLFAAFIAADTVVVGDYSGVDPVNAAILDRNAERLSKVVTASGPLKVVRLPMPPPGEDHFGGTYTNVVFANGVLLVPTYPEMSRETEGQVMATYRRLLPGWDVVGIDSGELISHGGALRCVALPLHRIGSINAVRKMETGAE